MKSNVRFTVFLLLCAVLSSSAAAASEIEWSVSGVAVCTSTGRQLCRCVLRDGRGGAFIGWMDERAGYDYPEYYVQKIDSSGTVQWTANGVAVKSGDAPTVTSSSLRLAADGEGGVIAVWTMFPDAQSPANVYAQRVDADGDALWTSGGELVYESYYSPLWPRVVPDWRGGALVLFQDVDLLVQRIGPDGDTAWENATIVGDAYQSDYNYEMIADGEGGAFIAYVHQNGDIMLYAIDCDGGSSWFGGARTVCDADSLQFMPRIISDGAGGCIVTWYDARNHAYYITPDEAEIYAQRYDATGSRQWAVNGVQATPALAITDMDYYSDYSIAPDDSCGVVIAVPDGGEVLASRVRCDGTRAWGANGVVVCSSQSDCPHPQIAPDGNGGSVIAWCDDRSNSTIYAQRLDRGGQAVWTANGVTICPSDSAQSNPILTDGGILAWYDFRNGNYDVYAQRLAHPSLQYVPACDLWATYEFDVGGTVDADGDTFMCGCPGGDWDILTLGVDLADGDMVGLLAAGDLTMAKSSAEGLFVFWLDPVHADSAATSGNGWETTLSDSCVSVDTPGPGDDCTADSLLVRFREFVLGHAGDIVVKSPDYNADGTVNLSDISFFGETYNKQRGDAGYNDYFDFNGDDRTNLSDYSFMGEHYTHSLPVAAPAPMFLAVGGRGADARLVTASRGDRLAFTVFIDPRVEISAAMLAFDGKADGRRFVRWEPNPACAAKTAAAPVCNHGRDIVMLSAFSPLGDTGEIELGTMVFDIVENGPDIGDGIPVIFAEALAADGAIVRVDVTGGAAEETPALRNHLGAAYPNPFNPSTRIDFSIDRDARVVLAIYDINGALVRTLVEETRPAAHYSIVWDGTNDRGSSVASGIYFYRVKTAFFEQSRKMVLLR